MPKLAFLEAFDTPFEPDPPPVAPGPSQDWLDGHAAGHAAAMAEMAARQDLLGAELCQAIADLNMSAAEARKVLFDGLGPLFEAISGQLLPAALRESFARRLAADLAAMAAADLARPLSLRVCPDAAPAVSDAIAGLPALAVEVTPDPGLDPLEAVIAGPSGESAFDLDRLLAALQAALANLIPQETSAHA